MKNRLVRPMEWKSFADQLDTLRELKDFLTVDGVLGKVCGGGRRGAATARTTFQVFLEK